MQQLLIQQIPTEKLIVLSKLINEELVNRSSLTNKYYILNDDNDSTCAIISGNTIINKQDEIMDICSRYGPCELSLKDDSSLKVEYEDCRDCKDFLNDKEQISKWINKI